MTSIRYLGNYLFGVSNGSTSNTTIRNVVSSDSPLVSSDSPLVFSDSPLDSCCINVTPQEGWVCSICQEGDVENKSWTQIVHCTHRFHAECLGVWVNSTNGAVCPECRAPILVSEATNRNREDRIERERIERERIERGEFDNDSDEPDDIPHTYDRQRDTIMADWDQLQGQYHRDNGDPSDPQYVAMEDEVVLALTTLRNRFFPGEQPYNYDARGDARRTVGWIDSTRIRHVNHDSNADVVPHRDIHTSMDIPTSMSENATRRVQYIEASLRGIEARLRDLYEAGEILFLGEFPYTDRYVTSMPHHITTEGGWTMMEPDTMQQAHRVEGVRTEPAPLSLRDELRHTSRRARSRPSRSTSGPSRTRRNTRYSPMQ